MCSVSVCHLLCSLSFLFLLLRPCFFSVFFGGTLNKDSSNPIDANTELAQAFTVSYGTLGVNEFQLHNKIRNNDLVAQWNGEKLTALIPFCSLDCDGLSHHFVFLPVSRTCTGNTNEVPKIDILGTPNISIPRRSSTPLHRAPQDTILTATLSIV